MVSHWNLSDNKSPQGFLILADLNNAVVVSTPPVISKSSNPCTNPLVTVPRAPIRNDTFPPSFSTEFSVPGQRRVTYPSFHIYYYYYYYYYCYYYYYSLITAFHISVSEWFFTGVWVTASLLRCPGLFLVFWPFSTALSFGWSPLVRQLPGHLVPLAIL